MEPKKIVVTTSDNVPGYEITDYVGLVWGTSVRARFIGHDLLALLKTLVGGEVDQYTKMSNEARLKAIRKVVSNAKRMGADAVIGFELTSSQILPGTIEIMGYGTAVKLKKRRK